MMLPLRERDKTSSRDAAEPPATPESAPKVAQIRPFPTCEKPQSQSGSLAPPLPDAITSGIRDAGKKFPSPDGREEPIQASSGFHLCIWPQAGQRNGTATQGRLLSRTHSVLRPVGTGAPVRGH